MQRQPFLAAGAGLLIGLVMALPFVEFINFNEFGNAITNIVNVCGEAFTSARGLINCFLLPFGRTVLTGLLLYLFGKWAILISIKTVTWVYHIDIYLKQYILLCYVLNNHTY